MEAELRLLSKSTVQAMMALPQKLRDEVAPNVTRSLAKVIHALIIDNLSGPQETKGSAFNKRSVNSGHFPVNVVQGFLRASEQLVMPGTHGLSMTQAAFINTAGYAEVIHKDRPFMGVAFDDTAHSGLADEITGKEIAKAMKGQN